MTKSIIDTLIFVLLILIIIYYLGKMFGLIEPCQSKSNYRGYEYNEFMEDVPKNVTFDLDENSVTNSLNNLFDNDEQQKLSQSIRNLSEKYKKPITTNADHVLAILQNTPSGTGGPQHTGEPLQTSEPQHTGEPHVTQDFNTYQNDFYNFNDKLNYSLSTELNTVDKLNECKNDISRFDGMKISDIYDNLVESKKCMNNHCIIDGLYDGISNGTIYANQGSSGLYLQNFSKKYETDDVNTGGKFYDNIEGVEDDFSGNLAL